MSPLELALLTNLLLCSFVLKWLIISTTLGLLMACLDDSSYHDPSSHTIHTVLNMLGICSWVFIRITVDPFHTTITSEPPKELRVHFLPLPESGVGVCVEGVVIDFSETKEGNGKLKSQNDNCVCGRPGEGFLPHCLERTCCFVYLFLCALSSLLHGGQVFLSSLSFSPLTICNRVSEWLSYLKLSFTQQGLNL